MNQSLFLSCFLGVLKYKEIHMGTLYTTFLKQMFRILSHFYKLLTQRLYKKLLFVYFILILALFRCPLI